MNIEITGVKDLEKRLNNLAVGVKDTRKPLQDIEKWVMRDIDTNWGREGALFGGWEPLAASTRQQRARLGFPPNRPILQRTGKLRKGTESMVSKDRIVIKNDVPYFKYHQTGGKRLPQRKILELRPVAMTAISKLLVDWIADLLR